MSNYENTFDYYLNNHGGKIVGGLCLAGVLATGFRIVRPMEKGLVEIFGKYHRTANAGLQYIPPIGIGQIYRVPVSVQRISVPPQNIITSEQLNATIDAQVYYKVKNPYNAFYNVDDYSETIPSLAQTTLRKILGTLTLKEANGNREKLNNVLKDELQNTMDKWGMEVLNVEVMRIEAPYNVQESMNSIIVAEQKKIAAQDDAKATETKADGEKMAEIKKAEGEAQKIKLEADAQAYEIERLAKAEANKIQFISESTQKYFTERVQEYTKYKTSEIAMKDNTKYIIPLGVNGIDGIFQSVFGKSIKKE